MKVGDIKKANEEWQRSLQRRIAQGLEQQRIAFKQAIQEDMKYYKEVAEEAFKQARKLEFLILISKITPQPEYKEEWIKIREEIQHTRMKRIEAEEREAQRRALESNQPRDLEELE